MTIFWRVLDANLNRAREGLRVCEEVARFLLESPALTMRCRRLRSDLDRMARRLPRGRLLSARNSGEDVGHPDRRRSLGGHRHVADLVTANLRRVQEALRVLEEFGRMRSQALSRDFGRLRFRAYALEQDFHSAKPSLRHR